MLPEDEIEDGEGGAISCKRELCGCHGVCVLVGDKAELIGTFFTATHKTITIMTCFHLCCCNSVNKLIADWMAGIFYSVSC
jgi:hypothetical protein